MIDWSPYAKSIEEKSALFGILSDIVRNPTDLTFAIQNRALVESGKFAQDTNGNLTDDARNLYDRESSNAITDQHDTELRLSLIQSLQTAYVPESIDYLEQIAERDDSNALNQNSTSLAALDALKILIEPDAGGRPPLPDEPGFEFYPRIGVPLSERARSEDWESAVYRAMLKLNGLKDSPRKKILEKKIKSLEETAKAFLASKSVQKTSGKPSAVDSKSESKRSEPDVLAERSLAAEASPRSESSPKSHIPAAGLNDSIWIGAGVVVALVAWILWRRKIAKGKAKTNRPSRDSSESREY